MPDEAVSRRGAEARGGDRTGCSLRCAGGGDVAALVGLLVEFREYQRQTEPSEAGFRRDVARLIDSASTEFLLAEREREAVGFIQIHYRDSCWRGGAEAELEDVFVSQRARGGGLGRALVEYAIERARRRGCVSVGLHTNERNQAAIALYRRCGFVAERPRWNGGRQIWFERRI